MANGGDLSEEGVLGGLGQLGEFGRLDEFGLSGVPRGLEEIKEENSEEEGEEVMKEDGADEGTRDAMPGGFGEYRDDYDPLGTLVGAFDGGGNKVETSRAPGREVAVTVETPQVAEFRLSFGVRCRSDVTRSDGWATRVHVWFTGCVGPCAMWGACGRVVGVARVRVCCEGGVGRSVRAWGMLGNRQGRPHAFA